MIKVPEYKEPQHHLPSQKHLYAKKLYLPLSQHIGKPAKEKVKVGDEVAESQLIAEAQGYVSSNIHSPLTGKVINIENLPHPSFKKTRGIVIETKSGEEKRYPLRNNVDKLSNEELFAIISEAGIVGMGGATFPSHVKLKSPKKIDTFIVNICECEPYLACDNRLFLENTQEVLQGVEIISRICSPKKVIFAFENNKKEAVKKLRRTLFAQKYNIPSADIAVLASSYPRGGEKQLIYSLLKRKVPAGGLPFDVGCLVHNVGTIFAIYEAVYKNKPLIERLTTFAGDALVEPKNLWVKIGTTLKELFDDGTLKFKEEPKKIISGGPMMGIALDGLEYPILKGGGGFLFLKEVVPSSLEEETPCIRCARCVDACPMQLLPLEFVRLAKKEEYQKLNDFSIKNCIECGCCSYVCPAKIPIVHYIRLGKKMLVS